MNTRRCLRMRNELIERIKEETKDMKTISTTYLQRKYRFGYGLAKQVSDALQPPKSDFCIVGLKRLAAKLTQKFATT